MIGATAVVSNAQEPITDSQRIERFDTDVFNPQPPTSPRDLRPRVGEKFTEPPPVSPVPQALADGRVASKETAITLESMESMACNRNPTLAQAQAQIQGELGKAVQAGLLPNPTLQYVGEQWGVGGTARAIARNWEVWHNRGNVTRAWNRFG